MKSRLFLKILAVYVVIIVVVLTLDSFFVAYQTRQDISRQIKEELTTNIRVMLQMPLQQIIEKTPVLSSALGARVTIVDASGIVLTDSEEDIHKMDNHINRPEIQEARLKGQGSALRYSQTLRIDMMYVAIAIKNGETIGGYVRLSKPLRQVNIVISRIYRTVYRTALIILISFLLLALIFIPRLISPLLRITAYTERVRGKGVSGSLLVNSGDEIGLLADNINLLVQKYEDNLHLALEEREKLESAFSSMVEGIVILNHENRIERINKSMQDIIGNASLDVRGKTTLEVFRNVELQDNLIHCQETEEPFSQEISFNDVDPKILNVSVAPIKNLPAGERKTIMVFHDVTQLRKLERVRADFVANVTHEIKTPLTAIIGFVQTLQEGAIKDQTNALRFLEIISEHALRLNRLVDDLLILSGIELGDITLHLEKIDARKAALKALAVVEKKAKEKGLAIKNNWPATLPAIMADTDRIIQILVNVLDNAVKFTNIGGITISASQDERGYLAISIADTGAGIPRDEIPRLGERFYRVDKMRSRELGGTGLGLSIVKHLLKAHNGWMEVESHMGIGTVVKLFFPFHVNNGAPQ
jgi:two-component system, OmpR family, phosphate regulon sensor histidine kinase PhoR